MKIVILEAETLGYDVDLSSFYELCDVTVYERTLFEEACDRVEDADIIIVNKVPMNEISLSKAKNLKLIALTATGTNNVDFNYTKCHNITVANVKGYSTDSVVQHTFAMLFYIYEKLSYYDEYVKSEQYVKSPIFSFFEKNFNELSGKRWGIIGLGEIGKGVARIAKAFGCDVVYYSTTGNNVNSDYKRLILKELLGSSDIISIHAPLNEATKYLIGNNEFDIMKKSAVIVNVGRGAIIDQNALYQALIEDKIAGAALDVLEEEPISECNPLLKIKDSTKLLITPHIAWATVEARKRCANEVYLNIKAFLNGEKRNVQ